MAITVKSAIIAQKIAHRIIKNGDIARITQSYDKNNQRIYTVEKIDK